MNGRVRVVFGLAALFAANLCLTTVAFWASRDLRIGGNLAEPLAAGFLFGQVGTLGLWLTLGDGKWYWRLVVTFLATMLIARSETWAEELAGTSSTSSEQNAAWATLVLLWILSFSVTVVWPLRFVGKWRFVWWLDTPIPSLSHQFHIGDLLFWMVPIGGMFAVLRLLTGLAGNGGEGQVKFVVQLLAFVLVVTVAMRNAFAQEQFVRQLAALFALTLLIGGAFVCFESWDEFRRANAILPWKGRFAVAVRQSWPGSLPFFGAAAIGLFNGLSLRALGCTLFTSAKLAMTGIGGRLSHRTD